MRLKGNSGSLKGIIAHVHHFAYDGVFSGCLSACVFVVRIRDVYIIIFSDAAKQSPRAYFDTKYMCTPTHSDIQKNIYSHGGVAKSNGKLYPVGPRLCWRVVDS